MMTLRSAAGAGCLAVAMMALPLAAGKTVAPAHSRPGVHTEALLKELRVQAADAAKHASVLDSLTRVPTTSWSTQGAELEAVKEDINQMGQKLADLEKVRDTAKPWERKAIDQAAPLLRQMADNTEAALKRLDDLPSTLWALDYQEPVHALADESSRLSQTMGEVVKFAKVHEKEMRLEHEIGLAAGSQ